MKALKDLFGNIHSIKEIIDATDTVIMSATGDQPHPIYDVHVSDLELYYDDNDEIIEVMAQLDQFKLFTIVEINA